MLELFPCAGETEDLHICEARFSLKRGAVVWWRLPSSMANGWPSGSLFSAECRDMITTCLQHEPLQNQHSFWMVAEHHHSWPMTCRSNADNVICTKIKVKRLPDHVKTVYSMSAQILPIIHLHKPTQTYWTCWRVSRCHWLFRRRHCTIVGETGSHKRPMKRSTTKHNLKLQMLMATPQHDE